MGFVIFGDEFYKLLKFVGIEHGSGYILEIGEAKEKPVGISLAGDLLLNLMLFWSKEGDINPLFLELLLLMCVNFAEWLVIS